MNILNLGYGEQSLFNEHIVFWTYVSLALL